MGDRSVFGFARAVRHDATEAVLFGEFDGFDSLGEGADLVGLDKDGVAGFFVDAALEELGVSHEEVVADKLDAVAEALGKILPAMPIVFAKAVFDGDDGIVVDDPLIPVGKVIARLPVAVGFELIMIVFGKLGSGNIHSDSDIVAETVVGGFDSELNKFERFVVAIFDFWRVAALVADGGGVAAVFENLF